jgi:hypothetical protein
MKKFLLSLCLFLVQGLTVEMVIAQTIFEDNFESGKGSAYWTDLAYVTVVNLPPETNRTGYGMKFHYVGNSNDTIDATAEARFDLRSEYTDLSIEFDLFIPTNYVHVRPSDRVDNNKFFRLWRVAYSEGEQIGASTVSQSGSWSAIGADYKQEPTWAVSTALSPYNEFITEADLGKWMSIKINAVAPKSDTERGTIQIWKNDQLIVRATGVANSEPGEQGWRYGYLLGWANSGFRVDTDLYIDNVKMFVEQNRPSKVPDARLE